MQCFKFIYEHVFFSSLIYELDSVIDTRASWPSSPAVVHANTTTTPVDPFDAQNNIIELPMVV